MGKSTIHPKEVKELLWTNPNPGVAYSTTTLTIDLSPYTFIEVWYQENAYGGVYKKALLKIGIDTYIFSIAGGATARQFITTTSSITIYSAIYYNAYGGNSATTNNNVIIPYQIYGIK